MERTRIQPGRHRPRLARGTRLNNIYEIDELVAIGGMGEVYRGHTIQTGDVVAIKVLLTEFATHEAALALFRKEASVLHNLAHDAIVRYYVFSVDEHVRVPYLAMEFVDGRSLLERLEEGPLSFEEVDVLRRRLALAMQEAHDHGIVHRDLSPDNVILPKGDVRRSKIIDFGIARSLKTTDQTVIGSGFAGKYNYVSPEQLGLAGGRVDARSDIYSLGLLLAAALRGEPLPMEGTQLEVIEKRRTVPDLTSIDSRFRPLLHAMLQPDPQRRISTMREVAEWEPERVRPKRASFARRLALVALIGFAAAGLGVLVAYVITTMSARDDPAVVIDERLADGSGVTDSTGVTDSADGTDSTEVARVEDTPPPDEVVERPPDPGRLRIPFDAATVATDSRTAEIVAFVDLFNNEPCFYASIDSVGADALEIRLFGADPGAFEGYVAQIQRRFGIDPDAFGHPVTRAQCPVLDFAAEAPSTSPIRLAVARDRLRPGEDLAGDVDMAGGRSTQLVLVDAAGRTYDLSEFATARADGPAFRLRIDGRPDSPEAPNLILAVSHRGAEPIPLPQHATAASEYFPALRRALAERGDPVALKLGYFVLNE